VALDEQQMADISLGFQNAVVGALLQKTKRAVEAYRPASLTLVGGVAANAALRKAILQLGERYGIPAIIPSFEYCGDNAAMIAYRAKTIAEAGFTYSFDYEAFPAFSSQFLI
jgi:N6-L-threonylcarbamoyladenine synthase